MLLPGVGIVHFAQPEILVIFAVDSDPRIHEKDLFPPPHRPADDSRAARVGPGHGPLEGEFPLDRKNAFADRAGRNAPQRPPNPAGGFGNPHRSGETAGADPPHHRLLQPLERGPHLRKEDRLEHRPGSQLLLGRGLRHRVSAGGPLPARPHRLGHRTVEHFDLRQLHDRKIRAAAFFGRQHLQPQQTAAELLGRIRLLPRRLLRRGLQRRQGGLRPGPHHDDGRFPHLLLLLARGPLLHRRQRRHRLLRSQIPGFGHGRPHERHPSRRGSRETGSGRQDGRTTRAT